MIYVYRKNQIKKKFDSDKAIEPVTKAVRDTNEKLLKENQPTTKAIEDLIEPNVFVKLLEMMKRWGNWWILKKCFN